MRVALWRARVTPCCTRRRERARRPSFRSGSSTSRGSPASRIVMLEPRRLAARAAADRMASLLGEEVGATVGYRTRDERRVGRATRIEVITEGILTRRLQQDPSLPGVGLVIFDEIHERNLQTDLALALTLDARSVLRPDLRVLAMSATLDTGRVAALLGGRRRRRRRSSPAPGVPIRSRSGGGRPIPRDRPAEAVGRRRAARAALGCRRRAGVPRRRRRHPSGRRRPGRRGAARRRRASAVRRTVARRAGPGPGAVAARTPTGRAGHRHRRDQPHRRRRADRGRQRAGAQPALRPAERADAVADRAELTRLGRPAGRAGRAHRARCRLSPVVRGRARPPAAVRAARDRVGRPGRARPGAGAVGHAAR